MLSKAEIQDYTARLNRLGITDAVSVKAVLDFVYSIALIAIMDYEEKKDHVVEQDNTKGQEDCSDLDPCQHEGTGR